MPTYLVRTIKGHDLVGVFVAPNVFALALLVDECTDPGSCEYQRMKPGGIMWTSPAVVVPIEDDEEEEGSASHCGVEFVRAFDAYRSTQFARRLASKGKFHLL